MLVSRVQGPRRTRVEVVDAVGDAEPGGERDETDAAGNNEGNATAGRILLRGAQPGEELVDAVSAIVSAKQVEEEGGQFVKDEENRLWGGGAGVEEFAAEPAPVTGIESGPNLEAEFVGSYLVDLGCKVGHRSGKALGERADRVDGLRDEGDDVLGMGGFLEVDEEEMPAVDSEASAEFAREAGFSHAALAWQEDMVAVGDAFRQQREFRFSTVEIAAVYPIDP